MALKAAAVVPHAPLLTLGRAPEVAEAVTSLLADLPRDVPWILVSPHGSTTAFRRPAAGSLAAFGIDGVEVEAPVAEELMKGLQGELADPDPADEGIVVPLHLLGSGLPEIVALSFEETTGPGAAGVSEVLREVPPIADPIERLARSHDLVLVVSGHSSASLSPGAPLTDRPEGHELHERVMKAFAQDATAFLEIPPELWASGGACGAAPFTLLGHLCGGWGFEVTHESTPFGVGYVCARGAL